MLVTPSPSTNRRLLTVWATFAGINVALMWLLPGEETVPFHFVWISLALVYGFTHWRTSWMVLALVAVVLSTGLILAHHAGSGQIRWEETTEEPLMTGIFIVMVWHVHRRQVLLREVQRIHELERRRLERQQLFIRLASHELRTPITVARGYTELIRAAQPDDDPAREDSAIVLEELDKVAGITQRLVTLMQLDQPHPLRPVDLDAELLRIARRWEPTAGRIWSVRSSIGEALISPERFEAALDCLLENAVKFTGPGDLIELTGHRTAEGWILQVHDSGVGISPETADRVLSHSPGERTGTGTGLGLAIVRGVVERLGGALSINGIRSVGTTVTILVPQPPIDGRGPVRLDPTPTQTSLAEPAR
jgi:two-component system, OmpR family, sensor kinase